VSSLLTGLHRAWKRLRHPARRPDELHRFWRDPTAPGNAPADYLSEATHPRSRLLVETLRRHAAPPASVLELGCNAGRNLTFLHESGYGPLGAVEVNAKAVDLFRKHAPDAAAASEVRIGTLEEELPAIGDRAYDVVFSMAVLEHVHTESEGIFEHVARIAGSHVVTIEDEHHTSWRHFPRDYRRVFEGLGLEQVEERRCDPTEHALSDVHVLRVFRRAGSET
jgi:2-polyprenyl-3-methyl-5-hydroxy-6-metoxy-1,4-benzoquinol methylase